MIIASVLFATGGSVMKLIPWSPLALNGARNVFAAMVTALYMLATHHKIKINKTVLLGAFSMFATTTLFVVANKFTTAANAIILQYTCPIWIIVLLFLFFRKKPIKKDLIAIGVVFVGILCFFFDSIGSGNMLGNFSGVASGVFYAGVYILNEFEDGDTLSSFLLGQIASGLILSPLVVHETNFTPIVLLAVFYMGAVQIGLAYVFFSEGTKYTPPVTASLINAVEPVLNPMLVAIFFHEMMAPLSLVGAFIVIGSVVVYNIYNIKATTK